MKYSSLNGSKYIRSLLAYATGSALNINPIDVAGAGDSLLAATSLGLASGNNLMLASAIGAGMASLAVQNVGNIPVSNQDLKKHLKKL